MARNRIVEGPSEWKQNFKKSTIKIGFCMNLTRAMLEFLCATADDVNWDRALFGNVSIPDNWMATGQALFRRGLVERKDGPEKEIASKHNMSNQCTGREQAITYWKLTPAGDKLVELLKITGLFIVADSSHYKKRA